MLKAVVFDMDNTLLILNVDWRALTEEIDVDYFNGKYSYLTPHKFFVTYFGRLLNRLTGKQQNAIRARRLAVETEGIVNEVCFPYQDVIAEISRKYRLGVVSGNYRATVKEALLKCGLLKYMKAIVTIDECPNSKPSPIPLLMALDKLKVKPYEAVYVGDHPDDIRAGKAAGMRTIGVAASKFAFNRLKAVRPDAIVKDIGKVPNVLKAW